MYTQQPNMYQQQQTQAHHLHLNEQDVAGLVLSELKRTAEEYTTAALESSHPAVRQQFIGLLQKTLQDQAELFHVVSQMNGYSGIKMASQQEIQQELQQQSRKSEELRGMIRQTVQGAYAGGAAYQPFYGQTQSAFQGYSPSQQSFQSGYGSIEQSHSIPTVSTQAMSSYGSGQSYGSFGGQSSFTNQHQASGSQGLTASSNQAITSSLSSSAQPSASYGYGSYSSNRDEDFSSKSASASSEVSGSNSESSRSNKSSASAHNREHTSNKYVF